MRMKEKERTKTAVSFSIATRLSHCLVFISNGGKRSGSIYPIKTEKGRGGGVRVNLRPFLVVFVQALESLKGSQSVKLVVCLCIPSLRYPSTP